MYKVYNVMTLYSMREMINNQIMRFPHDETLRLVYKEIVLEINSRNS